MVKVKSYRRGRGSWCAAGREFDFWPRRVYFWGVKVHLALGSSIANCTIAIIVYQVKTTVDTRYLDSSLCRIISNTQKSINAGSQGLDVDQDKTTPFFLEKVNFQSDRTRFIKVEQVRYFEFSKRTSKDRNPLRVGRA